jgi:regulator of protease activity HflC (stomatin/prohibitin superfamily)
MKRKIAAVALLVLLGGCSTSKYIVVETDETAYSINLNSGAQASFNSPHDLAKAATKVEAGTVRISSSLRWVGFLKWQWVPDQQVYLVSRERYSRWWTEDASTGTSTLDESIRVRTKDQVVVKVGITLEGFVPNDGVAAFVYYRRPAVARNGVVIAGKGSESYFDANVRGYLQDYLSQEAASMAVDEFMSDLPGGVLKRVRNKLEQRVANDGVEISSLGLVEARFDDPNVQASYDNVVIASQERKRTDIVIEASKQFGIHSDAIAAKMEADNKAKEADSELLRAKAELVKAEKWRPTVVGGSVTVAPNVGQ